MVCDFRIDDVCFKEINSLLRSCLLSTELLVFLLAFTKLFILRCLTNHHRFDRFASILCVVQIMEQLNSISTLKLVFLPLILWSLIALAYVRGARQSTAKFKQEWIGKTFKLSSKLNERVADQIMVYERGKNRILNAFSDSVMTLVKNVSDLPVKKRSNAYDSFTVESMPNKFMVNILLPDGRKSALDVINFDENDFMFEEVLHPTNKAITHEEDPLAHFNKLKEANFVFAHS